ncbi:hypothetical protein ACFQV2_30590 [Actinokineospora soli]|uniref:Acetyltransferase (GNAT) domain-containing protein n=1 Tax=Actinokineospora soli TaxID=1048753 RepID=A0ABW2TUX8_9PSEU
MTLSARVHDPRADDEPEGWAGFAARCRLHAVWDYGLMRLEAWLSRNPAMLGVVRDGDRIVAAATVLVCRPWWTPRYAEPPTPRTARLRPRWAEVYTPWLSGYPAIVFDPDLSDDGRRAACARSSGPCATTSDRGCSGSPTARCTPTTSPRSRARCAGRGPTTRPRSCATSGRPRTGGWPG